MRKESSRTYDRMNSYVIICMNVRLKLENKLPLLLRLPPVQAQRRALMEHKIANLLLYSTLQ